MRSSFRRLTTTLLAASLFSLPMISGAMDLTGEDTDLFLTNPSIAAEVPNVLIVLDNTSNWSNQAQHWPAMSDQTCMDAGITGNQQGDSEVCAIYKQVGLLNEAVNVGLMMFNGPGSIGAYVRFAIRPMNATNRTAFQNALKAINTNNPGDKGPSNTTYEDPMNDAFRYLNSLPTLGGAGAAASAADPGGYTSSAETTFSFANPSTSSCGYNYIIFIGNGFPNADNNFPADLLTAAGLLNDSNNVTANTSVINTTGSNADVWSRFLYNYGVKVAPGAYRHVTTYTINVCKDLCDQQQWPQQETLLKSMADVSYGGYFKATSLEAISTALKTILSQAQAVNSVFAATSLPVSINVRGTNLNQVYIGVFRPDPQLSPRWFGNLKQYELGVSNSTGSLQLIDANAAPAVNLNTGFVANTAKSFWTTSSSFWSFRSPFKPTDVGGASDSPDGDLVEKGGAAERIRVIYPNPDSTTAQTRNIYTCTGSCLTTSGTALSSTPFNAANTDITSALLGTFQTVDVTSLTASGQTATATTAAAHGFNAGDQVTVAGAVPTLFNGTYTVATVPSTTTFTYSLSPNTPDTTHAYVTLNTLSSSGLAVSTDLVTVGSATPADYNQSDQTVSPVVGNTNQVSYPLATSPTSAAIGYSVTAKRKITSLSWDSGTRLASVGVAVNHNYVTGDSVTISGVTDPITGGADPVLNGTFSITRSGAAGFTYSTGASTPSGGAVSTGVATTSAALPTTWSAGASVKVSGTSNANYDTTGTLLSTGTNSFSYNTNGSPSASVAGTFTAQKIASSDTNMWTVSSASPNISGGGSSKVFTVTLTLTQNCRPANSFSSTDCGTGTSPSEPTAGQNPQTLDSVTNASTFTNSVINVAGVSCTTKQGNSNVGISGCSGSGIIIATPVTNTGGSTFTIQYQPAALQGNNAPSNPTVITSNATVSATGPTGSPTITVTSIVPGNVTVNRTGTMYASKSGDLTSYVTSIANQSVALGTITAGLASNPDPNERANLIAWVRGLDNKNNENLNNDPTDVRASVHGDVLHSRPAVVNYNRNGDNNDVYLFYGSNDGMFHGVKGGLASDGGNEQWDFIPREFFGKLKRLRNQTPIISSTSPRDYFFDGSIGIYSLDADSNLKLGDANDKVYLFIGMRRGGRYIYALDVSNPANPKFLWKKGCPNPTGSDGCDPGYAELGQTWSEPKLGYVRRYPNKLVLIFGAGYDSPVEDFQPCAITSFNSTSVTAKTGVVFPSTMTSSNCPPSGGSSATVNRRMGRGIYMVDALNGNVLWRAVSPNAQQESVSGLITAQVSGMDYAIPADLAVLKNRDNTSTRTTTGTESVPTGYLDRIYAVDTGGNVWRVDVSDPWRTNWVVTKLAAISDTSGTTPTNMRKFLSSPDVVYSGNVNGNYDAVLLGSGDREHPFDQIVANRFYMFKDTNTGTITPAMMNPVPPATPPATLSESNLVDVTSDCLQSASLCTGTQTQTTLQSNITSMRGWLLQLTNTGEKTIAPATTSAGTVIFNTNQPMQDTVSGTTNNTSSSANFCTSDLGTARQYGLNYQNATSNNIFAALPAQYQSSSGRFAQFAGGGFLPAPVPVVVQIDGRYYQTVISGVQATNPGGLSLQTRLRTYWYNKTK